MKTLKIQVLGTGLIPRGKGIAPKKEPFSATRKEIELIMEHGTLRPRMYNTNTGKFIDITSRNFDKLWDTFAEERETRRVIINRQKNTSETPKPVKKEEPKQEAKAPSPQPQLIKNNNQNNNQGKPKWEQKQEHRQEQKQEPKVEQKPAEAIKKEEEKNNDDLFTVATSSDKK